MSIINLWTRYYHNKHFGYCKTLKHTHGYSKHALQTSSNSSVIDLFIVRAFGTICLMEDLGEVSVNMSISLNKCVMINTL